MILVGYQSNEYETSTGTRKLVSLQGVKRAIRKEQNVSNYQILVINMFNDVKTKTHIRVITSHHFAI